MDIIEKLVKEYCDMFIRNYNKGYNIKLINNNFEKKIKEENNNIKKEIYRNLQESFFSYIESYIGKPINLFHKYKRINFTKKEIKYLNKYFNYKTKHYSLNNDEIINKYNNKYFNLFIEKFIYSYKEIKEFLIDKDYDIINEEFEEIIKYENLYLKGKIYELLIDNSNRNYINYCYLKYDVSQIKENNKEKSLFEGYSSNKYRYRNIDIEEKDLFFLYQYLYKKLIINQCENITPQNTEPIEFYYEKFKLSDNFDINLKIGEYYQKLKQYNKAVEYYEFAKKINTYDFDVSFKMGKCYQKLKRYERAIECYEFAKEIEPENKDLINKLIECYYQIDDTDKIEDLLEEYFGDNYSIIKKVMIEQMKKHEQEKVELLIQKEQENSKAKLEEKNRIIQNLYHNLKNKIPKIYFSIENIIEDLEEDGEKVPNTLRNSLLIAKDLEDTANAILGASKISKDYLLLAIKNQKNETSLKKIIYNSILNALNYIKLEENKTIKKLNIDNMEEITQFIKEKLFDINLNIEGLAKCKLSTEYIIDNKYSVTSVLSNMFDELMINLFKYTLRGSFVDINITNNSKELIFLFKNRSKRNNNKSTGKGRYIIETTIQSIGGEYKHYWENDIYITKISLNNHWSNKND